MTTTIRSYPSEGALKRLPLTLTIEMTVEEWQRIREGLDQTKWPESDLRREVGAALEKLFDGLKIYHRVELGK